MPPPEAKPPSRPLLLEQGGFEPYLRALRRHPLIVAAVTIAAVAGTTVWLALRPVSYDAIAQVLVTPVPSDDPNYLGLPVVREPGESFLGTRADADSRNVRAALAGAVGWPCSCSVYPARPAVCRSLEAGGAEGREARRRVGLPA